MAKTDEGQPIEVPAGYDAGHYRLTGDVSRSRRSPGSSSRWMAGDKVRFTILDGSARGGINHRTGRSAGWLIEGARMAAKYVLGIDLGTTNSVVAYAPLDAKSPAIELLEIPQLVAANTIEGRHSLPSFLYLSPEHEASSGALDLPWESRRRFAVGEPGAAARRRNAGTTVVAAKSWLAHRRVDRRQPILPYARRRKSTRSRP